MGDSGGLERFFLGTQAQRGLFQPLGSLFLSAITGAVPGYGATQTALESLLGQVQRDTTAESKALSERIFRESLLGPSLDMFRRETAPAIGAGFAGIGGTLSSRRGQAVSQALTDIQTGAQAALASQLPAIHAFPLQQTLGQISGVTGIQGGLMAPISQALQFALGQTVQPVQTQGDGLAGALGQLGGTVLGSALGGPTGGKIGGSTGGGKTGTGTTNQSNGSYRYGRYGGGSMGGGGSSGGGK